MENFSWECSTRVRSGQGCVREYLAEMVRTFAPGGQNILLGYGGGSVKKNGAYDDIMAVLTEMGYSHADAQETDGCGPCSYKIVEFTGIMSNPTLAKMLEGAELARRNNIGLIIGAGGGSVKIGRAHV